jgi:hypothetical protein
MKAAVVVNMVPTAEAGPALDIVYFTERLNVGEAASLAG